MNKFITRLLHSFSRLEPAALIVIILSIFHIGFRLYSNEEVYFGMAKAYMDPQWMSGSTLFTDFAGTRLLFQIIIGWLLEFMSFEKLAFFGRLAGYILLAFPIAAIARELKINNIILVFWLTIFFVPLKTIFYITPQSFFAGEWVFGGFETKTLAYVFVFWSIWFLFNKRYIPSVIFAATAVYWHMLVGGWYCFYLFIFLLVSLGLNRQYFRYVLIAGLILLPFTIYIYLGVVSGNEMVVNGINTGRLYAYFRNPQHIGLMMNLDYFLKFHAGKVILAIIAFILAITVYRKKLPSEFKWMNTFLIIILAQNLLFLIVALFDKNGSIAKFYPWRGSTLAMFFFQITTIVMLRHKWIPGIKTFFPETTGKKFYLRQMSVMLFLSLLYLGITLEKRIEQSVREEIKWREVDAVAENLKSVSEKGDKFLLYGNEDIYNISIPRKAGLDIFYLFRCVPSQTPAMYNWYMRGIEQEKVEANINYLVKIGINTKIKFIVSNSELKRDFLTETFKSENYRIYKVKLD